MRTRWVRLKLVITSYSIHYTKLYDDHPMRAPICPEGFTPERREDRHVPRGISPFLCVHVGFA
ncbi:hypothetical protein [Streptomyces cyaneogriseus]|uniref:hypothetical protein n=1 Tax=Streptomyces cyaneogriseus TaxID=68192 RepID=UPI000AC873EC|nr:hypothetical protein [Streptomyces cyaneogriseus]